MDLILALCVPTDSLMTAFASQNGTVLCSDTLVLFASTAMMASAVINPLLFGYAMNTLSHFECNKLPDLMVDC